MILSNWKTLRLIIIGGMIAVFVWLSLWVMPTLGFFNLEFYAPPITENGASIIFFKEGKTIDAYSLIRYTLGWQVVIEVWPLILFGAIIGYPFGEFVVWRLGVEELSGKALKNYNKLSQNLSDRERRIEFIIQENINQLYELTELKNETKHLQATLFRMKCSEGEQTKNYKALRHKAKSLEKDLSRARSKIRRLTTKKRGHDNSVDTRLWE